MRNIILSKVIDIFFLYFFQVLFLLLIGISLLEFSSSVNSYVSGLVTTMSSFLMPVVRFIAYVSFVQKVNIVLSHLLRV